MTDRKTPKSPDGPDRKELGDAPPRHSWSEPEVTELPRLTELTLQTGGPTGGGGGTGGGGSTVF